MIKVRYNIDLDVLRQRYLTIFDKANMKKKWRPFEIIFGVKLDELLTADFKQLVGLYYKYKQTKLLKVQLDELEDIFNYEHYQPKLAWFFMNPENKFDFSTCHYCNTAYVNAYGLGDSYQNVLDFVNNATFADWRYWFTEKELPDDKIDKILREGQYTSLTKFNAHKYLGKKIELYKRMMLAPDANHFDLDHVLPKAICPITRLSLFNFVPSCQVCNEKLKKDEELADNEADWLRVSPTYQGSSFDKEVTFRLIPEVSCSTFFELMQNRENYRLEFDMPHGGVFDNYVTIFRLQDRYNYHKQLALHILDLKERYSEEKVKEISRMMSKQFDDDKGMKYSEAQVKEDIFCMDFSKDRCFAKLRKDMMERN